MNYEIKKSYFSPLLGDLSAEQAGMPTCPPKRQRRWKAEGVLKLLTIFFFTFALILFTFNYTSAQQLEIQWQNCFGDDAIGGNDASCIAPTSQGYFFAMQARVSGPPNYHGNDDIWLVHIDTLGNLLWEKCYGGSEYESPYKIIKVSNNEYYIYCTTNSTDGDIQSYNHGYADIWVIKINGNGDIIWERCYGSSNGEQARTAHLTPDGGLLMLSRVTKGDGDVSEYFGSYDIWLTKIDSLGDIEWERTYGNQYLDNVIDILLTSDSCILLTGANDKAGGMVTCHPYADYAADVWLLKLDMLGNIIWQGCYGGTYYDLAKRVVEVSDGYIIAASTNSNDGNVNGYHGVPGEPGKKDIWVFKINFEGNLLWQKCFGGGGYESLKYFSQTENGSFIIIGSTSSNDGDVSGNHSTPGERDIWMFEFSDGGELLWQRCYGGWRQEGLEGTPVYKISDYNYVIAANTNYATDDVQCETVDYSGDAWVFEIKDTTVGIQQTPLNDVLKVYPNPTNNYVIFELPVIQNEAKRSEESNLIRITNTLGQQVAQLKLKGNKTVWDTRSIQAGVYFYFLEIEGKPFSGKVVIQK